MPADIGSGPAFETVPLRLRQAERMDLSRAEHELLDLGWLGSPSAETLDVPAIRRIETDLDLPILDGSGPSTIRKAALLEIGEPQFHNDGIVVDIAWRSATLAPLFPVFAGRLEIYPDGVVLDGRYTPPFGRLGLLIDRGLLHLVARRTASALLARFVVRFAAREDRP